MEDAKVLTAIDELYGEIEHWKAIANDLWWCIDDLDRDVAYDILTQYPELEETEEYLKIMVRSQVY